MAHVALLACWWRTLCRAVVALAMYVLQKLVSLLPWCPATCHLLQSNQSCASVRPMGSCVAMQIVILQAILEVRCKL